MNRETLYTQWTHQRREVTVPEDFCDSVMAKVTEHKTVEGFTPFDRLGLRSSFLARWAAAISLIALGIYRVVFVTANLILGSTL